MLWVGFVKSFQHTHLFPLKFAARALQQRVITSCTLHDCNCCYQSCSENFSRTRNSSSVFILAQTKEIDKKKIFPKMTFKAQSVVTKCSRMALRLWQLVLLRTKYPFSEADYKEDQEASSYWKWDETGCFECSNQRRNVCPVSNKVAPGNLCYNMQPKFCECLKPGSNL